MLVLNKNFSDKNLFFEKMYNIGLKSITISSKLDNEIIIEDFLFLKNMDNNIYDKIERIYINGENCNITIKGTYGLNLIKNKIIDLLINNINDFNINYLAGYTENMQIKQCNNFKIPALQYSRNFAKLYFINVDNKSLECFNKNSKIYYSLQISGEKITTLSYINNNINFVYKNKTLFIINETNIQNLEGLNNVNCYIFFCHNNKNLISLEGGPTKVDHQYECNNNNLLSLKGSVKTTNSCSFANNKNLSNIADLPICKCYSFTFSNTPFENYNDKQIVFISKLHQKGIFDKETIDKFIKDIK